MFNKIVNKSNLVIATGLTFMATNANAALDATVVDGIKTEVLADVGTAVTAGFAVLGVVIASRVGMSLLSRFISKGAGS